MEKFKIENLEYTYGMNEIPTLSNISFEINDGDFVVLFGKSGCGKTTLLRNLKNEIRPYGKLNGKILFDGHNILDADTSTKIGFVMQNPDNQIVTDKVWHELSFGLENLNVKTEEIRARVSEIASFFNIQNWFYDDVWKLSSGQKQILNLASVMVMNPDVLILDEPTSRLDPISADNFIRVLKKINDELGTTIILSEHKLDDVLGVANKVIAMDEGKVISFGNFEDVINDLEKTDLISLFPVLAKLSFNVGGTSHPITVREGREWLKSEIKSKNVKYVEKENKALNYEKEKVLKLNDIWFRYDKNSNDILKGVNLEINKGEIYSILGGNGTGKTTLLSVICKILKPYNGKFEISETISMLPQNPRNLFVKSTVLEELSDMSKDYEKVNNIAEMCEIKDLLERHPLDLSGGEEERVALAKVLLFDSSIILLDEPTKGMDGAFKEKFVDLLKELKKKGKTIVIVSHDMEFCAEVSDRCALFFDGQIISENASKEFFENNKFYTTVTARLTRNIISNIVYAGELINLLK